MTQVDGEQTFEEMERTTKFTFVGVKYESLTNGFQMDQEVEFKVRGVVVGCDGIEKRKDGTVFHPVKIGVTSVAPLSFEEPAGSARTLAEGESLFSDGGDE